MDLDLDLEMLLQVSIRGKVTELAIDGIEECLKRLVKKYLGIGKRFFRKPNHKQIILQINQI
jgi:hypothetical protein